MQVLRDGAVARLSHVSSRKEPLIAVSDHSQSNGRPPSLRLTNQGPAHPPALLFPCRRIRKTQVSARTTTPGLSWSHWSSTTEQPTHHSTRITSKTRAEINRSCKVPSNDSGPWTGRPATTRTVNIHATVRLAYVEGMETALRSCWSCPASGRPVSRTGPFFSSSARILCFAVSLGTR